MTLQRSLRLNNRLIFTAGAAKRRVCACRDLAYNEIAKAIAHVR